MKLSVLDLSIVPKNGDRHQAIKNTLETAQLAETLGFERFWVAEHHAAGTGAGRTPEVMIPYIASHTNKIKVGSGAVLLNHYSPFKVAETFNSLEEMFPGRIDMGIGRATSGPIADFALQKHRTLQGPSNSSDSEQLVELLHWMNQDFEGKSLFSKIKSYNNGSIPDLWLLGSSYWSSNIASQLGIRYVFAGFINAAKSYEITQNYIKNFSPIQHASCIKAPELILALNVFVAETKEAAIKMTAPLQLFEHRLRTFGDVESLLEDEDEALKILGNDFKIPEQMKDPKNPPKIMAGTPEEINSWLTEIADTYHTDEIMIQTITGNHEARLNSLKLMADMLLNDAELNYEANSFNVNK